MDLDDETPPGEGPRCRCAPRKHFAPYASALSADQRVRVHCLLNSMVDEAVLREIDRPKNL